MDSPELQEIEVGDLMAWTPGTSDGFLVLEPIGAGSTRRIVRASGDWDRAAVGLLLQLLWRPLHFAMQRKQLLNLRRRSESTARSSNRLRPPRTLASH